MMRHCKLLGLALVLVGASSVVAQTDGPPSEANKDAVVLREIRDLKASIDSLTKAIKSLQDSGVANGLVLQKTQGDIDTLKRQIGQLQQEEMNGMRQLIVQLQRDIEDLKNRAAIPPRVSGYQPTPPAPTGRIRIVNAFSVPQTVVVNGAAYNVTPGAVVTSNPVPAGVFSYEVLGVQALVNRSLTANETFTITIHP